MNRRYFLTTALAAALAAGPAFADPIQDAIVRQLSAQGFTRVQISRTLLGRLRFIATSSEFRREIIVNARTGEILRDYTEALGGGAAPRIATSDDDGDDDRNDDRDDDRDDDKRDDDDSSDDDRDDEEEDDRDDEDDEPDEKDEDETDDDDEKDDDEKDDDREDDD